MNIKEIMTKEPEVIDPTASLVDAATKMRQLDIGVLPVCENDRLIGTLTDRDITIRAASEGRDPRNTSVRDVMSPGVKYCYEDQRAEEAGELMERDQIRRLLVLNREKRLVGIVSLGDLCLRNREDRLSAHVLGKVSAPSPGYAATP